MIKLKKADMKKRDCIHCKYYSNWRCMLDVCFMNTDAADGLTENAEPSQECEPAHCMQCAYRKPEGCVGFCMQNVIKECQKIWGKDNKKAL
jgi:hypothetical protein